MLAGRMPFALFPILSTRLSFCATFNKPELYPPRVLMDADPDLAVRFGHGKTVARPGGSRHS